MKWLMTLIVAIGAMATAGAVSYIPWNRHWIEAEYISIWAPGKKEMLYPDDRTISGPFRDTSWNWLWKGPIRPIPWHPDSEVTNPQTGRILTDKNYVEKEQYE